MGSRPARSSDSSSIEPVCLLSLASSRPPVAKVAPKVSNVSAKKPAAVGDDERAELLNEVSPLLAVTGIPHREEGDVNIVVSTAGDAEVSHPRHGERERLLFWKATEY